MSFLNVYKKYLLMVALVWAACFIIFVFVYVLVLGPQLDSRKRIEDKLADTKLKCESIVWYAREDNIAKLSEQIELLQDKVESFAIDFEDSANLTFDISRIAGELKISSFSIKSREQKVGAPAATKCKYVCENQIDVGFVAGFHQFATFLNALERHRPILLVERFVIESTRQKLSHQVNLNLVVLVKKPQDG